MLITVYTKERCPQCVATRKALSRAGVEFAEKPLTPEIVADALQNGWRSAPVVISDEHPELSFAGFSVTAVEALTAAYKTEE